MLLDESQLTGRRQKAMEILHGDALPTLEHLLLVVVSVVAGFAIALGMAVLSLSFALFFSSIAAAILTLVAMVIIDLAVIRREEAYLIRRFGGEYAAYRAAVRRWF